MIKEIEYEFNWCDYLTKCPHYKTIDIGSFDCHCCKFNEGFELEPVTEEQEKILNLRPCDKGFMQRYKIIQYGKCKCSHR